MKSIWIDKIEKNRPSFEALDGDKKTDVLIVGGGIAGVLCAYMLRRAGVDCLLVEKGRICEQITQNTTAKITLQHGLIYDKMIKRYGLEKSRLYLEAQKMAIDEYSRLCKTISCNYEIKDSYVYSLSNREKIEKEVEALNRLGCEADFVENISIPVPSKGAVRVLKQAQFHPLKFLLEISRNLPIYESTKVTELKPRVAVTNKGNISYSKMIVATHFPFLNKHGGYYLKMHQHRSYVIALKNAQKIDGMYVDENDKGLSFRNYQDVLLLGGAGHRTGKQGGCWQALEGFAGKHYPKASIIAKWATQDCITLDSIPYIGQYSKSTPNLFVTTGFNKWGMTSSMVSAMLLSDLVTGKENEFASVFSPSRSIMHPALFSNLGQSLIGLLTPTAPRCPHLGCALKYNREEHSWDCPCHGSRFDENGMVLDNPATDDSTSI